MGCFRVVLGWWVLGVFVFELGFVGIWGIWGEGGCWGLRRSGEAFLTLCQSKVPFGAVRRRGSGGCKILLVLGHE